MASKAGASMLRHLKKSGHVKPLYEKYRYFPRARPENYGNSWLKNTMAEAPEIILCSAAFLFSGLVIAYRTWRDENKGYYYANPYKRHFIVMRPDDDRVRHIQKQYYSRNEEIYDL